MEQMKETNPTRWRIEALGDFVSLDKLIFNNYLVEDFDFKTIKGELLLGMDFGFIADPSVIVASILDEDNKCIHIFQEWEGQGKTNEELARVIQSLGFAKSTIMADAAEPKSIEEIRRLGVPRIRPCVKGPDSIVFGIQKLLNYKIIVHPSCTGIITEFENYSWSKDRNGEYINKPAPGFDHFCDALRYSLQCVGNKVKVLDKNLLF
jgi:phage terminase large subunit